MLQSFLQILLSKKKTDSARVMRLTTSIGQDVIYAQSKEKKTNNKHLQLGIITKRQTGSRFLIESLNRLGHSIGYDEVNNVETYFAEIQANVFAPSFQILSYPLHLLLLYTKTVTTIVKLYLAYLFIVQMVSQYKDKH